MEDQESGASGAETVEDTVFLGLDVVEGGVSEDAVVVAQGGEGDTVQVVEGMGIVLHQDDDDGGDNEVPRGRRKSSKEETAERLKLAVAEYRDEMWSSIRACAKHHRVSNSTLRMLLTDPEAEYVGRGNVSKVLTKWEEEMIAKHITERMMLGCGLDVYQVRTSFLSCIFKHFHTLRSLEWLTVSIFLKWQGICS